jgi:predicted DNA-binding transcriptional regulator AlpA
MIDTRLLVDYRGLAKALGLTERWVKAQTTRHALARRDPIPHFKIGRLVRFDIDEVIAWLRRTKHFGPTPKVLR